ncbi:SDR family oxidoreductase [Modestobacter excelsi]|uniref:SDR family oxidoreductase n=1 Tax=Modestobacter excelsi TaxID=2213161 RepID=UPI00110D2494|nr:SDR family oxidoreductase [Modestobacter excelsi]
MTTGRAGPHVRERLSSQQPAPAGTRDLPDLLGQTILLIAEGSAIGREIEERARAAGAQVLVAAGQAGPPFPAADALPTSATSAPDPDHLDRILAALPRPIDHVLVTGAAPYQAPLVDFDISRAAHDVDEHFWLPIRVARSAVGRVRPGGMLLFVGGTAAGRRAAGPSLASALIAARPALIASLAREVAPIRVNLIGAGLAVDRPLSARLLGATLDQHLSDPGATLAVARVVRPADVARLAVHLMCAAVTGATYDVDGGGRIR